MEGSSRAYHVKEISQSVAGVSQFGRAIANMGALNAGDIVSDLVIGSSNDSPLPGVGSVGIYFMNPTAAIHDVPSPPPLPPPPLSRGVGTAPALPLGATDSGDALTTGGNNRDGVLIGLWVILVIAGFLCGSWALYFYARGHASSELYKTNYLMGPFESAAS